jgi:hypothetical protein
MMIKEQRQLLGINKTGKKEKHKQLAPCHTQLLENGLMRDGIKCICHICLQQNGHSKQFAYCAPPLHTLS